MLRNPTANNQELKVKEINQIDEVIWGIPLEELQDRNACVIDEFISGIQFR